MYLMCCHANKLKKTHHIPIFLKIMVIRRDGIMHPFTLRHHKNIKEEMLWIVKLVIKPALYLD